MTQIPNDWRLDSRLAADTMTVHEDADRMVLLMNDRRWPWLILVPKVADAQELHDLPQQQLRAEAQFAAHVGQILKRQSRCEKINIATIGNSVRQLHIHIIARSQGDANWPGPVWGYGKAAPYSVSQAAEFIDNMKEELFGTPLS